MSHQMPSPLKAELDRLAQARGLPKVDEILSRAHQRRTPQRCVVTRMVRKTKPWWADR